MKNCNTTEQQSTQRSPITGCLTALGLALTFAVPQAAHAQNVTPPSVPAGLEVPPPNVAFLVGHAIGTQNYECQPSPPSDASPGRYLRHRRRCSATRKINSSPTSSAPPLKTRSCAPRGKTPGTRARCGRRAIAAVADPNESGAIAWVKLQTAGTAVGPTGGTTLSKTTFVQRVNTVGGSAPATGCNVPTDIGRKAFVPYTADYFFYQAPEPESD